MTPIGKSLHISWKELACHDGTHYPSNFVLDGRLIELVVMFEKIRFIINEPIIINSAYRTVEYNKKVGGSPKSQHLEGKALDLRPLNMSIHDFYRILLARYEEFGIRGLGKYKTFCHCDIRNSDKLVTWDMTTKE